MMTRNHYHLGQRLLFLLTFFVLMSSFYFQYILGLQPCPLCLMQRFCVMVLFMLGLMGVCLSTRKRARMITCLQVVFAVAGFYFAMRQVWLQSLSAGHVSTCMPGFDMLFRYFSWHDILHALFFGAGDCSEVSWQWLGLSMPAWVALYFIIMGVANGFLFWRLKADEMLGRDQ